MVKLFHGLGYSFEVLSDESRCSPSKVVDFMKEMPDIGYYSTIAEIVRVRDRSPVEF